MGFSFLSAFLLDGRNVAISASVHGRRISGDVQGREKLVPMRFDITKGISSAREDRSRSDRVSSTEMVFQLQWFPTLKEKKQWE